MNEVRGRYQTSAPTPTNGQSVPLQMDADGNLKVSPQGGGDASEATLLDILAEQEATNTLLGTTATELPKQPLMATSDLTHAFVTSSSSGEQDMVTATASQTTRVHRMVVTAAAATVVELRDGASGTALKTIEFPAAGAFVFDFSERPYVKTTANTKLVRNSTVATKVTIDFDYVKSA